MADKFAGSEFERRSEAKTAPEGVKGRKPGITSTPGKCVYVYSVSRVRQICREQIWSLERSGSARRVKTRMVLNNPSLSEFAELSGTII